MQLQFAAVATVAVATVIKIGTNCRAEQSRKNSRTGMRWRSSHRSRRKSVKKSLKLRQVRAWNFCQNDMGYTLYKQ